MSAVPQHPLPGPTVGTGVAVPGARRPRTLRLRPAPAGLTTLRQSLPELARHPAVVATAAATATVGTRLAVHLLERLLDGGTGSRARRPATQPRPAGVQQVGVVHHVVHHVIHYGSPALPPWPITPRWPLPPR